MNRLYSQPQVTVFAQIDLKNAVMLIKDGTGTPLTIEVTIGEGNLTYSENRNVEYTLNRGLLDEVRLGDEVPVDVSFDFTWEYITGDSSTGGIATVEDALKNVGLASAWISSDSDVCRPFAVDIEVTYTPGCVSGDEEILTLADFRYESLDHDLRNGSIAVSGKCNITAASILRQAQTS